MTDYPNPNNNPTLEGYDILATSPEVETGWGDTVRALVVRYTDLHGDEHVVWQEKSKGSSEWQHLPGGTAPYGERVIMALMGIK